MAQPDTYPHSDQDPVSLLTDKIQDTLQSEESLDNRQQALLGAFINTLDENVSPTTLALLQTIHERVSAVQENTTAFTDLSSQQEISSPTERTPVFRGLAQAVTRQVAEVTEAADDKNEEDIAGEVKRIVGSTMSRVVYGKFIHGLHLDALNEKVGALNRPELNGRDEIESYPGGTFKTDPLAAKAIATTIDHTRQDFKNRSPSHFISNTPWLVWGEARSKQGGEVSTLFHYNFPTNRSDAFGRSTLTVSISTVLPRTDGEALRRLIEARPEALEMYLHEAASGLTELDDPERNKEKFIVCDEIASKAILDTSNEANRGRATHPIIPQATLKELFSSNAEGEASMKLVEVPSASPVNH